MENVTGNEPVGATGGQPSADAISHDPLQQQQQQQPQGPPAASKLRKSAFRFFGGRRSICMLPNFFGGRGKTHGRNSASKTGVTKSQTYDGVSRACWESGGGGGGDVTSADFEFHGPNGSGDPQKTHNGLGKSQSLPRQRRGLRGLFSSIRRHRKSKNAEVEKSEALESSSGETVPDTLLDAGRHGAGDDETGSGDRLGKVTDPDVPTAVKRNDCATPSGLAADECSNRESLVPEKRRSKGNLGEGKVVECRRDDDRRVEERQEKEEKKERKGKLAVYHQPLSADSEMDRLAEINSDLPERKLPVTSASSDNVNLMFGDVSSLKSFDSLTGCGDIIADQDDVSVAESSVSGERGSRSAGKRSSCLVTYQGGGEEMATPDDVDSEYLHSLWESDMGNEVCYLPSEQTDSTSITPDQPVSSFHVTTSSSSGGGNTTTSPLGTTETALTPTDLLTPHSDRQESVPNSDEGYYDSTTPGADEDSRERPRHERLPRDSYSGDALYELYEPDDRLLSPTLPSKDGSCGFLGGPLQAGKGKGDLLYALTSAALESGAMETEEERLSKIQHALLCCELQNLRSPSKDLYQSDCFYDDDDEEANRLEANCEGLADEELNQHSASVSLNSGALKESGSQLQHGLIYGGIDEHEYALNVSQTPSPLQDNQDLYPEQERCQTSDESSLPPTRGCSQSQEELMVCFSQALVDFTKNTRIYRNSTESLEGSESSSPFGPSLSALPAIVTFDVVDMENEGECEQQTELVEEEEEEELSSPYEPFEDDGCYLQQDAFAECDQRTFVDTYEQSLLLSNAWGITSLPRHLSLGRPYPPVPAPLALNRRSRSLDTDSLDFQTSDFYTSVPSHGPKITASFHRRKTNPETEDSCDVALPRQPGRCNVGGWRQGQDCDFDSLSSCSSSQQQQKFAHWRESNSGTRQTTVRPSHLPLQATFRNSSQTRSTTRTAAEGRDVAVAGGGGDALYPCSYPHVGTQFKSRPVGVTQGIPHLRPDQVEDLRENTAKNRRAEMDGGYSVVTAAPPKRTM